jgi:hypothetical protein
MPAKLAIDRFNEQIELKSGGHSSRRSGVCATEAIAWLAGEPHTATPSCLSPVLRAFLQRWNDGTDEEGRQRLKPYLPRTIGTAGDGKDELRGWLAADWAIRVVLPTWLEVAGASEAATALRKLPEISSRERHDEARPLISKIRSESWERRKSARARFIERFKEALKKAAAADAAAYAAPASE